MNGAATAAEGAVLAEAAAYARDVRVTLGRGDASIGLEAMVARALGPEPVRSAPLREEVIMATIRGQRVIVTSSALSPKRARWCVAHAFAEWLLERDGHADRLLRRLRAPLAAELLLPTDTCRQLLPIADAPALADALRLPLSFMLLREAEVFRVPTALVVPGVYARVLGDDNARLPGNLAALELLASRRGIGVSRWDVPEDNGIVIRVAA